LGAEKRLAVNVDKRTRTKSMQTYTEQEVGHDPGRGQCRGSSHPAFSWATGFRIGEAAVAEWMDINWEDKDVRFASNRNSASSQKDYEERTIVVSDTLLACLKKYRGKARMMHDFPIARDTDGGQAPRSNHQPAHRQGERCGLHG